jgi:membrane protein DedA with SNARE-associated domain
MLDLLNELTRHAAEAITQGNPTALLALFFISALTEVGIPFPFILDTILIFTGYQKGLLSQETAYIMLSLMAGRILGASVIYWLTRFIGRAFIKWISRRFPFLQKRMDWLTARLSHRAPLAVAIARLTPGLLTPSTVAAGVICIRYWHLILGIAISSVVADGVLLVIGFVTGRSLDQLGIKPSVWLVIIGLVIIVGIIWAINTYFSKHITKS